MLLVKFLQLLDLNFNSTMKNATKYKIHKTIGIIVVPIFIIATLTGFFRAHQKLYWEDGYKKKKQPATFSIQHELVSINTITRNIDSISKQKNKFEEIILKTENEKLYYKILTSKKGKYLVDATNGTIVSPISQELAKYFSKQYVKDNKQIISCELIENYMARKAKEPKPAYKISFNNSVHSEIYLDSETGDIIEDYDDNRAFGIWIMRLHEYDFFNSKKSITTFVTIIMMLLAISGLWIYKFKPKKVKM